MTLFCMLSSIATVLRADEGDELFIDPALEVFGSGPCWCGVTGHVSSCVKMGENRYRGTLGIYLYIGLPIDTRLRTK
jgi:hypothetical protein